MGPVEKGSGYTTLEIGMKKLILVTTIWIVSLSGALVGVANAEKSIEIDVLYQNPFIFDASGRLLGAYTAGGAIINSKGYRLRLYTSPGYYVNWAIFFESPDCSGQGYGIPAEPNGDVFLSYDQTGGFMIAYTKIGATPVNITYRSLRRYNGVTHGVCEISTYAASYVPVFPNDPEITGVPSNVGTRDNPYPEPMYFERYLP